MIRILALYLTFITTIYAQDDFILAAGINPKVLNLPSFVSKVKITPGAELLYEQKVLEALEEELLDCGVLRIGTACLNSIFTDNTKKLEIKSQDNDQIIRFQVILNQASGDYFLLVEKRTRLEDKSIEVKFDFYLYDQETSFEEIIELYNLGELDLIVQTEIIEYSLDELTEKMSQADNTRKLYHCLRVLLEYDEIDEEQVSQILIDKKDIILQEKREDYQYDFLWLVTNFSSDIILSYAKQLEKSTDVATKILSSVLLLDYEDNSFTNERKEALDAALALFDFRLREYGILIYENYIKTKEDENRVIALMGDIYLSISGEAYSLSQNFTLTEENISGIQKALKKSPSVRHKRYLFDILSNKLQNNESTHLLIKGLENRDQKIRTTILTELKIRNLENEHLETFESIMSFSDKDQRIELIKLLARVKTDEALLLLNRFRYHTNWGVRLEAITQIGELYKDNAGTGILIGALTDASRIVQETAEHYLATRVLTDDELRYFETIIKSTQYKDKLLALKYLKTINSSNSTSLIFPLAFDFDQRVREEAFLILDSRTIMEQDLIDLGNLQRITNREAKINLAYFAAKAPSTKAFEIYKYLKADSNWKVHLAAVKSLSLLKQDESTSLLIDFLRTSNKNVLKEAVNILTKRSFNNDQLLKLFDTLNYGLWKVRLATVQILSNIDSKDVLDALVVRLNKETNSTVKRELARVIELKKTI